MRRSTYADERGAWPVLGAVFAILAALTTTPRATAQDIDISLAPLFIAGDETRYDLASESTTKQVGVMFPGGAMTQSVNLEARILVRVLEVAEPRATVEVIYERLRVDFDAPDLGISPVFDSEALEDASDGVLAATIGPIVGAPIVLTVAAEAHDGFGAGEILIVDRPDSVPIDGEFGRLAAALVSPQAVEANLQAIFSTYAGEAPRRLGSQWRRDMSTDFVTDGGVVLRYAIDYVVQEVTDETARMSLEGEIALNPGGDGPFKRVEMIDSAVFGETGWNHAEGKLVSTETTSSMKLRFDQGPGGALRLESTTHETVERVR